MKNNKIILTTALTGAVTPKSLNANIPITPEEIAEDAYNCWKAGAAIVHLHMRDDNARGVMDVERFRKTIQLIRAHKDCDVIINCTSSGTWEPVSDEQRMQHFTEIPEIEIGSYDAGTMNWGCSAVFNNSPQFLEKLAKVYLDNDVIPEIEIFDNGMISNALYYLKKDLLKSPLYVQMVLGVLGGSPATPEHLQFLIKQLPKDTIWSAFGIGKDHLPIMYAALAYGAKGLRVGLEDNVMYDRETLASNLSLTERAVRVIKEFGKEPATSAEAREILGLKPLLR
ncbi:3-keto-5-aminohexanoate cleavage protein [Peptoniphilaceae bacterium SGI.131]